MRRIGAAAAIVFAVAQVLSGLLPGSPPGFDAPPTEVAAFAVDHRAALLAAAVIGALAAVAWVVLLVGLLEIETEPRTTAILVGAAFTAIAVALGASGVGAAGVLRADAVEPSVVALATSAQSVGYLLIGVPVAVFVVAMARLLRRGQGDLIVRTSWVVAGAMLASQLSLLSDSGWSSPPMVVTARDVLFVLWLIAAAIRLGRSSGSTDGRIGRGVATA
jgi:hypothetical protein